MQGQTEMDTEAGVETDTSHSHSRHKKGHMINLYLADSDDKATVDFLKDCEELHEKTNEHFKDKTRKECLWEMFTNSRKLSKFERHGLSRQGPGMGSNICKYI